MTNKDAIWQQILANPRDEELRLIYADVLEELGEIEQATKIREQDKFTPSQSEYILYSIELYEWRGYISKIVMLPLYSSFSKPRFDAYTPIGWCTYQISCFEKVVKQKRKEIEEIAKGYPKIQFDVEFKPIVMFDFQRDFLSQLD